MMLSISLSFFKLGYFFKLFFSHKADYDRLIKSHSPHRGPRRGGGSGTGRNVHMQVKLVRDVYVGAGTF